MGKEFRIKGSDKLLAVIKSFSPTEKVIFGVFVILALLSAINLALSVNDNFLFPVPAHAGELSEGVVGLPRYVNPILAFTDVDRDLSTLIFSGLMKYDNGDIVPDLAKKYVISPDGLTYDFTLRDDLRFHDGVPLTADDVEFTVQKVEDSVIKSPKRADWANIEVKKISPNEIQFILKHPYAPFLSNLTLGIIPKHIWSKIDSEQFIFSQYNIEPIGAGPYKLSRIEHDSGGIPVYYALSAFSRYHEGEPFISNLDIYFYPNEKSAIEAYNKSEIEAISRISASTAASLASTSPSTKIFHVPLPRIFGIFFNQNQAPIFAVKEVRQALNLATDKQKIVDDVLFGYAVKSNSPLPSVVSGQTDKPSTDSKVDMEKNIAEAKKILHDAGFGLNNDGIMEKTDKKGKLTLEFTIATVDSPDLKAAAEIVKAEWLKIGARVNINYFEYGDLYQNIISTRKYDALLFGESIGKDLDLYAFWHSSQRNPPGLNVAMYVNNSVDKLLEDVRATTDGKKKEDIYSQFEKIIEDEVPAVFLYSPEFIYVIPPKVKGFSLGYITTSSDRFYGINKWYIATDSIWKVFGNSQDEKIINKQ